MGTDPTSCSQPVREQPVFKAQEVGAKDEEGI